MIQIRHRESGEVLHRVSADSLESACLTRIRLRGADLRDANFCGADLRAADLRNADLRGAFLTGANLQSRTYSLFLRTGLASGGTIGCFRSVAGILLATAIGIAAGLPLWSLGIALLLLPIALTAMAAWGIMRTRLDGATLRGATLSGANLANAVLRGADLREANLAGAVLTQASFEGADLRGADLTGAELRITSLIGADLRDTEFGAADLQGVWYDASTRWPDGFDPKAYGAKPLGKLIDYRKPGARRRAEEVSPAAYGKARGDEPSPTDHGSRDGEDQQLCQ
jgi:uncharacterized protein YjbI with pentapeptide repeats